MEERKKSWGEDSPLFISKVRGEFPEEADDACVSGNSSASASLTARWLMGSGLGAATTPATESILGSLPRDLAGVGSAVNDTTREVGGTLGVAVLGSIMASI